MATSQSRRSSAESDYRQVYEAALHDQIRDNIASHAQQKHPQAFTGPRSAAGHDEDTSTAAKSLTKQAGLVPERLAAIDVRLDPHNDEFDFRFWASTFLQLMREDGVQRASANLTFHNLSVTGLSSSVVLQPTVSSILGALVRLPVTYLGRASEEPKTILYPMSGHLDKGEMLLVLGRPGSGCTTFLRSITGDMGGLAQAKESYIKYDGILQQGFLKNFRGRAVYNQENDENFAHLTVAQTLEFAARTQTPQRRIDNVNRDMYATHLVNVMLRIFGLSHVRDTKVGNDTVRGVSGGERKRVSIAEMALTRSSLATWDNATRGLDSATALDFIKHLKTLSDLIKLTQAVAVYQASQAMYDQFDKVMVLYDGRQIYYGPASSARTYFQQMGWYCSPRQTTPDFLTSITNPSERRPIEDFIGRIPLTAEEFERHWLKSHEYRTSMTSLSVALSANNPDIFLQEVRAAHHQAQARHTRQSSPYITSVWMQTRLCLKRSTQLMWNDRGSTVALAFGRVILALIVGSIYYGPADNTSSLQSRGSVIFLATLMNALMAVTEVGSLFSKRELVLKQKSYGFYHPAADAFAAYVADIPVKFVISTLFNVVFYFLAGLRVEASCFFVFLLFNFLGSLMMSAVFRSIGASCKQLTQAYAICGIGILIMIIYTGFALQTTYMHVWFRWINYINPIAYVFEALLVNEVHGRDIPCAPGSIIPSYGTGDNFACAVAGAQPSQRFVSGDAWVQSSYGYSYSHIWRNLGIAFAYMGFFLVTYLLAVEYKSGSDAKPQRLIFRNRKAARDVIFEKGDVEMLGTPPTTPSKIVLATTKERASESDSNSNATGSVSGPTTINGGTLTWEDLTLQIQYQGNSRTLLDGVCGWVAPRTMTCLMGSSGAGKTTLLDTLAQRHNSNGKISGNVQMNGADLTPSFQRQIGYVQQQDLHLTTSTVREALQFSALLRQPASVSKTEKLIYVETVISMLNMDSFSECIVGRPGEGLNIEQRKLLTIAVELAAKPSILCLDEPTSGLDSQSAWTIVTLLKKLAHEGQTILVTIHQPSALILQQFDSILLMGKGGRTNYFGPIGPDCRTMTAYFESKGARPCATSENPAEYILSMISDTTADWPQAWRTSSQLAGTRGTLFDLRSTGPPIPRSVEEDNRTYAQPHLTQLSLLLQRTFRSYWRSPSYIYAKLQFSLLAGLFIGFTFFLQNTSLTGMQNLVFSIYMLNSVFSTVVNQVMSRFLPSRSLFEIREGPSRIYSWPVFVLSHIIVEIPYQIFLGVVSWACWYYPVFNSDQPARSQALMLGFTIQFMLLASTWAQALVFCMPSLETAGALSNILFTMTLQFNGVLQPPSDLPGFWIFMYRVSPFTYLVGGFAGTGLKDRAVVCARNELAVFDPPVGQSCGGYMAKYIQGGAPGSLLNPEATNGCEYCPLRNADQFLARSWIDPADGTRNFGILFVYLLFNVCAAVGLYWLFRVKRFSLGALLGRKEGVKKKQKQVQGPADGDKNKPGVLKKVAFYAGIYYSLAKVVLRSAVKGRGVARAL